MNVRASLRRAMSGNGIGARDAAAVPPDWAARALTAVRVLHTLVWALFAGCIVAIPIASALGLSLIHISEPTRPY